MSTPSADLGTTTAAEPVRLSVADLVERARRLAVPGQRRAAGAHRSARRGQDHAGPRGRRRRSGRSARSWCRWTASTSPTRRWSPGGGATARGRRTPSTSAATSRCCAGCATSRRTYVHAPEFDRAHRGVARARPCRCRATSRSSSRRATTCSAPTGSGRRSSRCSTRAGTSSSPTTSASTGSSAGARATAATHEEALAWAHRERPGQRRRRRPQPGPRRPRGHPRRLTPRARPTPAAQRAASRTARSTAAQGGTCAAEPEVCGCAGARSRDRGHARFRLRAEGL